MKLRRLAGAAAVLLLALGSFAGKCSSTTVPPQPNPGGGGARCAVGETCCKQDQCEFGGACNLSTLVCEEVSTDPCGGIGAHCCPPSSAGPPCAGSVCDIDVCQPCGHLGEPCCKGFNITECTCDPGLSSNGMTCDPS